MNISDRVPYGSELRVMRDEETGTEYLIIAPIPNKCRDCGVAIGELHVPFCCVEECPKCRAQALSCLCERAADA
jgi:predicted Zn-ribbon and HTH transcriptional regulator